MFIKFSKIVFYLEIIIKELIIILRLYFLKLNFILLRMYCLKVWFLVEKILNENCFDKYIVWV